MPDQEPFAALDPGDQLLASRIWERVLAKKRKRAGLFGRLFGGPLGIGLEWIAIVGLIMEILRLILGMRQGVMLTPSYDPDVQEAYAEVAG